jgi:hypothetical protein
MDLSLRQPFRQIFKVKHTSGDFCRYYPVLPHPIHSSLLLKGDTSFPPGFHEGKFPLTKMAAGSTI